MRLRFARHVIPHVIALDLGQLKMRVSHCSTSCLNHRIIRVGNDLSLGWRELEALSGFRVFEFLIEAESSR